ncbi:unnamed protein product [Alopecurus aequalis]
MPDHSRRETDSFQQTIIRTCPGAIGGHNTSMPEHFKNYDEAYDFYNMYAKHTGFGIKRAQRNKSMRYIRCVRQGKYEPKLPEGERQQDKHTCKTGCKALIRVKERNDGSCIVKDVELEHNHPLLLSPSMLVFMHSHKRVDSTMKDYIKDPQMSNVKHVNIMGLLSRLSGGRDRMGCHEKDVLNMKAANTRKEFEDDVQKIYRLFEDMKKENENFYYDVQVDEQSRILNIFWASASSRVAYQDFGDCITFDTTYKSNIYHMPLAVFVGVNNHLQSTIFVVALMANENIESFKWVFIQFLQCMDGKQPMCILTDQCPSMAKAIPAIFYKSLHKLCRWHITRKYKGPLKLLYKIFPEPKDELAEVLNHPLMPAEFETVWHDMVKKYNLQDVNVIMNLLNERTSWISAYWKEVFCARMTSTQRSESMNFVLKRGFVKEQHDLHIFVQQVNNYVQSRHEAANAENIASMAIRRPVTRYGFEEQVLGLYTKDVYLVFKERQYHSTAFRIKRSQDKPSEYLVYHCNQSKIFAWSS